MVFYVSTFILPFHLASGCLFCRVILAQALREILRFAQERQSRGLIKDLSDYLSPKNLNVMTLSAAGKSPSTFISK